MSLREIERNLIIIDCHELIETVKETIQISKCGWCEENLKLFFSCICKEVN
jgi:hypothetical protein